MVCISEWRPTKIISPANWLWFLEGLPVKTSSDPLLPPQWKEIPPFQYIRLLCSSAVLLLLLQRRVPASSFNAQLTANDRCIKWSWDFNGHLSLAVKGRLLKSCWELPQLPVCQMDSFLPSTLAPLSLWLLSFNFCDWTTYCFNRVHLRPRPRGFFFEIGTQI